MRIESYIEQDSILFKSLRDRVYIMETSWVNDNNIKIEKYG